MQQYISQSARVALKGIHLMAFENLRTSST